MTRKQREPRTSQYAIVCGSPEDINEMETTMEDLHDDGYEAAMPLISYHMNEYSPAKICLLMSMRAH